MKLKKLILGSAFLFAMAASMAFKPAKLATWAYVQRPNPFIGPICSVHSFNYDCDPFGFGPQCTVFDDVQGIYTPIFSEGCEQPLYRFN